MLQSWRVHPEAKTRTVPQDFSASGSCAELFANHLPPGGLQPNSSAPGPSNGTSETEEGLEFFAGTVQFSGEPFLTANLSFIPTCPTGGSARNPCKRSEFRIKSGGIPHRSFSLLFSLWRVSNCILT